MAHRPNLVCLLFCMASNLSDFYAFRITEENKKKNGVFMTHENSDCQHL